MAQNMDAFVATIAALRAPDGCPWDREQTHESIAHNMVEEAYEAVDAIESGDIEHLREELGDVLLQVVLQSQIAADAGEFTLEDVAGDVNAKMIRRHPHVFGDAAAESASDVLDIWDAVKLQENTASATAAAGAAVADAASAATAGTTTGASTASATTPTAGASTASATATAGTTTGATGTTTTTAAGASTTTTTAAAGTTTGATGTTTITAKPPMPKSLLASTPKGLPALMQAQKISRKAVSAGFEWDTLDDVWAQVNSEIAELKAATPEEAEMEFGDVLFSLVNVARKMGIDAETALRASCDKFRSRWQYMERAAWEQGNRIEELTQPEQQALWDAAKQDESL